MPMFTVNLNIKNWPCLVVGGGTIALPKARRLIDAGADVTVVAPEIKEPLPGARLIHRKAQTSDLDGMKLAIMGTDSKEINKELWLEAQKRGILSMAIDDLSAADFFSPAVFYRGDLEIAVSTAGKGPAFSGRIRNLLAETLDEAYGEALEWYSQFRKEKLAGRDMKTRIGISRAILAEDFAAWFRNGDIDGWNQKANDIMDQWLKENS